MYNQYTSFFIRFQGDTRNSFPQTAKKHPSSEDEGCLDVMPVRRQSIPALRCRQQPQPQPEPHPAVRG